MAKLSLSNTHSHTLSILITKMITSQDIATSQTIKLEEMNNKYLNGELGLLKIKVYDLDNNKMLMRPVTKVTPKDEQNTQ